MSSSGALREMYNNPSYYSNLISYSKQFPNPSENQIELDLRRTFPDNPRCLEQSFLNQLRNILICYSIRNSSVGYCQGMNFIVGKLLLVIEDEESVFWLFVQIVENLLPLNYYAELAGVITDSSMLSILLQKYLPELFQFFISNQFELTVNNFIHKWLVCVFTQSFNLELSDIILDFFFLEGSIILIKTCLGVLAILQKTLMSLIDFEEIYSALTERTNDIKDPRLIIYFLCVRRFEFNSELLNLFRQSLKDPVIENLKKEKKKRKALEVRGLRPCPLRCDVRWPFCVVDDGTEGENEFLVVKCQKVVLIEDYYYCKEMGYPKGIEGGIDGAFIAVNRDVLCERQKHHCDDRKLVENSILMLDEDKMRLCTQEYNKQDTVDKDTVDLYEIVMKGKGFEKAKNRIMKDYTPAPILQNELTFYYA